MPIYEYRCNKCGEFEVMQRITDKPLTKCPTCKAKVNKLMSNTSFQLKGSGWYVTDYARSGKGKDTPATSSESSSSEPTADSKSESKTESKTESSGDKSESKPKKGGADGKGKQAAAA